MITYSEYKIEVRKHLMWYPPTTPHSRKHTPTPKKHTFTTTTTKQLVKPTPRGQSVAIAPILVFCAKYILEN